MLCCYKKISLVKNNAQLTSSGWFVVMDTGNVCCCGWWAEVAKTAGKQKQNIPSIQSRPCLGRRGTWSGNDENGATFSSSRPIFIPRTPLSLSPNEWKKKGKRSCLWILHLFKLFTIITTAISNNSGKHWTNYNTTANKVKYLTKQ